MRRAAGTGVAVTVLFLLLVVVAMGGGAATAPALEACGDLAGTGEVPAPTHKGRYTQRDIASLWIAVGGPKDQARIAGAVGMAESGGDPNIVNSIGAGGLMQIHPPEANYLDPETNMRIALRKWTASGWQPWEAFTGPDGSGADGPYLRFLNGEPPGMAVPAEPVPCPDGTMSGQPIDGATVADVLGNPRIVLTAGQRADLESGGIDARLVASLAWIGKTHTILVTALRRDHKPGTNHEMGRAVDIGAVDNEVCSERWGAPPRAASRCGRLGLELAHVRGRMRSTELIWCWDLDPADPNVFARADHCNHLHLGWDGPLA